MDDILALQRAGLSLLRNPHSIRQYNTSVVLLVAVFASLEMTRANSLTPAGQCRLAPLIPCIQDSCQLYDYIVKMLFKLHASMHPSSPQSIYTSLLCLHFSSWRHRSGLPADTLGGHRTRFYDQYKALVEFYHQSANLQFFKNLIRVPHLPKVSVSVINIIRSFNTVLLEIFALFRTLPTSWSRPTSTHTSNLSQSFPNQSRNRNSPKPPSTCSWTPLPSPAAMT